MVLSSHTAWITLRLPGRGDAPDGVTQTGGSLQGILFLSFTSFSGAGFSFMERRVPAIPFNHGHFTHVVVT